MRKGGEDCETVVLQIFEKASVSDAGKADSTTLCLYSLYITFYITFSIFFTIYESINLANNLRPFCDPIPGALLPLLRGISFLFCV